MLLTEEAMQQLNTAFIKHRSELTTNLKLYYSVINLLKQINIVLISLQAVLIDREVIDTAKYQVVSRKERLRYDADVIKHSLKAGLTTILALALWLISNWPGGLNGIISSIVISIRKNLFEMKYTGIYRLLGCLLGGGAALLSLSLVAMSLFDFILVLFFFVWGVSYFSFKYEKYTYLGLQANLALVITLAQAGGPPTHLHPPLERLGGIVIGILASFIVANIIWRSDVLTMLEGRLRKLYRFLMKNLDEALTTQTSLAKVYDLSSLFWLCRGLIESLNEENLNVEKEAHLTLLKQFFDKLVVIQTTISHILVTIDRERAHQAAAEIGFNLSFVELKIKQFHEEESIGALLPIQQEINEYLDAIERESHKMKIKYEQTTNLIAYVHALSQLTKRLLIDPTTLNQLLSFDGKQRSRSQN